MSRWQFLNGWIFGVSGLERLDSWISGMVPLLESFLLEVAGVQSGVRKACGFMPLTCDSHLPGYRHELAVAKSTGLNLCLLNWNARPPNPSGD